MRKRKHDLHIYFDDDEYMELQEKVLLSGLDKSRIIRLALKGQHIKQNPPREFYILLNKINNIGININQIAKIANQTGEIYYNDLKLYYNEIEKLMSEIKSKYL